ncbi:hypothetical protein SRABI80_03530 [Peribacillus frigoritolerans]|nr:hypothetical protein SRABI80_03530 [Peribacillus frigoritolerans]
MRHSCRGGLADSRRKGSGFPKVGMCNDFHSRHSLSAGGPGSLLGVRLRGLPWPRFSRRSLVPYVPISWNFFFKKYCRKTGSSSPIRYSLAVQSIFRQKEFRIALTPNQNLKTRLVYPSCFFTVILKGWKKFARLLPNNWLAETPQALVPRRLGRQSAERERISGINWNGFQKKKLQTLL